jgi:DNA polymerase III epsilon subunit-like protein
MNNNDYICFDFETGGKDRDTAALLQIAAVQIHQRKLTKGKTFYAPIIKPEPGFVVEDEALEINKIKRADLENAPPLKQVWADFTMYLNSFNFKKQSFTAPIAVGYNIRGYDLPIVERVCKVHGPLNNKTGRQNLFNDFFVYDIMEDIQRINENTNELPNIKFDTVREWLGIPKIGAHNAQVDVEQESDVFIRLLRLYREFFPRVKFKGSFNASAAV